MINRDSPVTEDELHAYIDGELPADRMEAVTAWLAAHPEQAVTVASWRAQSERIRARYGAILEEVVPERLTLDQVIRSDRASGRSWKIFAAAAALVAFFAGGATGWFAHGASVGTRTSATPQTGHGFAGARNSFMTDLVASCNLRPKPRNRPPAGLPPCYVAVSAKNSDRDRRQPRCAKSIPGSVDVHSPVAIRMLRTVVFEKLSLIAVFRAG